MRLLIVDEMHESIVPLMEGLGLQTDYFKALNYDSAIKIIKNYDGLLIRSQFFVDKNFLDKAENLKFIGRAGAGLDLIDLDACQEKNIMVFGANEGNSNAVAEHLIGLLLSLFNNISSSNQEVKQNLWRREENRGHELQGKTVGVIGYGHNGSATSRLLSAFGCKVLAYDKYKTGFGNNLIKESSLEEIFEKAEILTLHVPLTEETSGWVNSDFFAKFSKPIYFCNVARGGIVILSDLIDALDSGRVKGACLDVLQNEKPDKMTDKEKEIFDTLKNHPKVIITPHVAGWTFESYEKINVVLRDKIREFFKEFKA